MSGWRSASVSVTNEGCPQLAIAPVTLCNSTVAQVHQLCHGVHVTLTADAFQDLVEELRDHGGDKTNVEVKLGAGGCPGWGDVVCVRQHAIRRTHRRRPRRSQRLRSGGRRRPDSDRGGDCLTGTQLGGAPGPSDVRPRQHRRRSDRRGTREPTHLEPATLPSPRQRLPAPGRRRLSDERAGGPADPRAAGPAPVRRCGRPGHSAVRPRSRPDAGLCRSRSVLDSSARRRVE